MSSPLFVSSRGEGQHQSSLEVQQGLQPLVRGCGAICKVDVAAMPKELKTIVSEDIDVTVDDYEVYGFTHGNDNVLPHTDTLEDTLIYYFIISCRWRWPAYVLAGGAVCQPGAQRQLLRGGDARGTEHGITGSQRPWHP